MSTVQEALPPSQPRHGQDDARDASGCDDSVRRLKMGDRVQVVNRGDKCNGLIGVVRLVGDTDVDDVYPVIVDFESDPFRETLPSDELKLVARTAQQHRQDLSKGAKIGMAVAGVGIVILAIAVIAISFSAGLGFSQTEQKYLDATHNPCQHPEIFSNVREGQLTYCDFVWSGGDKTQVSEGHEICAIEKSHPTQAYEMPYAYLQSRHPDYSRTQINTQMIAAERTLC
jgi:hypothetical protein